MAIYQKSQEIAVPEWKVTYEGGFYPKRGREGKEIRIDKEFKWGNEIWHIPAVHLCSKGMVVDFCRFQKNVWQKIWKQRLRQNGY